MAKDADAVGRIVTFDFYIENLGSDDLTNLAMQDDLDAVFGAGNYAIDAAPIRTSGPSTVVANASYDGTTDTDLISGSLLSGQTAVITVSVEVTSITDQGNGNGIYINQVTITADDESMMQVSDLSDSGTEPDANSNGDASDAGEDDATGINLLENPSIGLAKAASLNSNQVTLDFYIENLGNANLSNLSLTDNLNNVFGAGNYSIMSAPSFIDDPGSITLNNSFNGGSDVNLISSGSLNTGDTAQIRTVVTIDSVTDQGMGLGVYENQATVSGTSPNGAFVSDLSNNGTDPDPNADGNPGREGVNEPTPIIFGEEPVVGMAIDASVNQSSVTLDIYVENFGNVTVEQLNAVLDFNAAFGQGNYFISAGPSVINDPGTLTLNPDFDGNFDTALFDTTTSTIAMGNVAQVRILVAIVALEDLGSGEGVYSLSGTVDGVASGGSTTNDISDDGDDADPSGNGIPNEAGENDPTAITVSPIDSIGVSVEYIEGGGANPIVILRYTVENFGNRRASSLTISANYNSVYGAGNYAHIQDPTQVGGANNLNYNAAFNGNTNTSLLNGGSFLDPGESTIFEVRSRIDNITDQGFGLGIYQHQVTLNGLDPEANPESDVSTSGTDPDPDMNGNPDEMDPLTIDVNQVSKIGAALDVGVSGNEITFDAYLENLGNVNVGDLSLFLNLDNIFGAGNYFVSTPPSFVDDPGTLTLEAAYDGITGTSEMLDITNSSLAAGDTAQIQFAITLNIVENQGLGLGNFSAQTTFSGESDAGLILSDTSDFGTDPDPDGDGEPNEGGENDATTFSVTVDSPVGVAVTAGIANFTVTLDVYLENLGAGNTSTLSTILDLDSTFGIGNYSITTPPSLIVDPGTLTLSGGFDGSENNDLLNASSTLNASATAQIQLVVEVTTESDQGNGFGVYSAQAQAFATQGSGVIVADFSDDGTDPDPNGNSDPGESGEDDATSIVIVGNPAVGISKKAYVSGTQVTFDFYVENLGDVTLSNFMMEDPLNPVLGSGNYSIMTQPHLISGPGTISLSPQYFGFNIFARIVVGGTLGPGEISHFRTVISVNTVSDQGNGFGVYLNGVTVTATDPGGGMVSDVSDDGINPDPNGNGNAGDAGEDDETQITIGDEISPGVALDASVSGSLVTFDIYLENLAGSVLNSVLLPFDLDSVFGAGNYSIDTAPAFIDDPGTINLDGGFDGSATTSIIAGGSTLTAMDTAQIQLVVDVTNVTDQGNGIGEYVSQLTLTGTSPLGQTDSDISDNGTDPDPTGNGLANDANEDDVTTFSVAFTSIGAALDVSVTDNFVTFDYYVSNLGDTNFASTTIDNVDYDTVFGAGNWAISEAPVIVGVPRTWTPNVDFDGTTDTSLVSSGGVFANTTEQIRVVVEILSLADVGSGFGNYSHQFTVDGDGLTDLSDAGTDPDSNNDGDADDAGEDDPTTLTVPEVPELGVALDVSVSGNDVTFNYYLEAYGNVDLQNLALPHALNGVFGAGNYTVSSAPSFTADPGSITLNSSYNGNSQTALISSGTLAQGFTANFSVTITVTRLVDNGSGYGVYETSVTGSAQSANATNTSDVSDDGTDPDPNGNRLTDDAGEDDPSGFTVAQDPVIGVALSASEMNSVVTFTYSLEAFGNVRIENLSLTHDLDALFGAGNYSVQMAGPTFIDNPGTLTLDNNFDGSASNELLFSGFLDQGDTAQFTVLVDVLTLIDSGSGLGVYSTGVSISGGSPDSTATSDTSDAGNDPDPNGNGDPNEAGENDATSFSVVEVPVVGLALNAGVSGNTVSLDYYLEAFGNTDLATINVTQDLDTLFGAGNYFIDVAPTFLDNPGTITLNTGFNGSTQTSLITMGSLAQFDTAQIRIEVTLTTLIDGGSGLGQYSTNAMASGTSLDTTPTMDVSDSGMDPDGDMNGDPTDGTESDPTTFTVAQMPVIGVALAASETDSVVTFTYTLEAFGTVDLTNISLPHDLDAVFGSGNYTVSDPPSFVSDPGTITLNAAFDGTNNLISSGTLAQNATAQFQVAVTIDQIINPGGGLGVYTTQVTASAESADSTMTSDMSDDGNEPDANSNGDPNEAGENDATPINVAEDPVIGVAQRVSISGNGVTFIFTLENLGNVTLTNIQLNKDLSILFGADFFTLGGPPSFTTDPGTLVLNNNYDGENDISVIQSGTLQVGAVAVIEIEATLSFVLNSGDFSDQTTVVADGEGGTNTQDGSVDGNDPDPDGDGNPGGAGEDGNTDFQVPNSSVGDIVFNDLNGNGSLDANEPGISGVRIFVDANNNTVLDGGEFFAQTDGNGNYNLDGLIAGMYRIRVDLSTLPPDAVFTSGTNPLDVTLAEDEALNTVDYGFQVQNSSLGGFVWNDLNGDGVQDMGEPGLADIVLFLDFNNNGIFEAEDIFVDTDANGLYTFSSLAEGDYNVRVLASSLPAGFVLTSGSNPLMVTLEVDEMFDEADFGFQQQSGSIGDFVWNDLNRDGIQDVGEPGLENVRLFLDFNGNGMEDPDEPNEITDANGNYLFESLAADTYLVTVDTNSLPANFVLASGSTNPVTVNLAEDAAFLDADIGFRQEGINIGDLLFNDLNGNGTLDVDEPGIAGITIFLDENSNGMLDMEEASTVTDGMGGYLFSDVDAGTYNVTVDVTSFPGNFELTTGSNPTNVTLAANEENLDVDFGFEQRDALISGFVYNDVDGNNAFDGSDTGLAGISLFLDINGNTILDGGEPSTVTDMAGGYNFTNLAAGTYNVAIDEASLPMDFAITHPGNPVVRTVTADEAITDLNFAAQQGDGVIAGTFFLDDNRNQAQDMSEMNLAGVTVALFRTGNQRGTQLIGSATTDANGYFEFTNLIQGSYNIDVTDFGNVLENLELTVNPNMTQVSLGVGETIDDLLFGYCQLPTVLDISEDKEQCDGDPLNLFVDAEGSGTLSYQWRKDGQDINNATNATYTINFADPDDSGVYTCFISNDCGELETDPIEVEVTSLGARFETPLRAQGVVPMTLESDIFCVFQTPSFVWTNLNTSSDFGEDENPVTLDSLLSETTVFQFTLTDGVNEPSISTQTVLVSQDPAYFDLNEDGCSNMQDMTLMRSLWRMEMSDPDGDDIITILDFFYINTENVGACDAK